MLLLLTGCLINTEVYERRKAELTDGDGDGYAMEFDCDDGNADRHPSAPERCDNSDQDCDGEIDEESVDMTTWFQDADGDLHGNPAVARSACSAPAGFVATADDCDDVEVATHPGAQDEWYDGVDANCDGADDDDADADGDAWQGAGGTDCMDDDPTVAGTAEERWDDAGIDNNCDGSIEDQALSGLAQLGTRLDGTTAGSSFGVTVVAVPAGWLDAEAVLLVGAPYSARGDIYAWRASDLGNLPSTDRAAWHLTGSNEADYLGYGMGWAGDRETPIVVLGAEGALDTRGRVEAWVNSDLASAATFAITGDPPGGFLGSQVVSNHDHDGDGLGDIVVTAPADSRLATNAGSAFVFLGASALTGEVSVGDADIEFTTTYAAALLAVVSVGDADSDGLDDLGFTQDIPYPTGPGGLLVTAARSRGSYDTPTISSAQFHGGPFVFSRAWDPEGDGRLSILAASGGIHSFALPLAGTVTPWDNAEDSLEFDGMAASARWIRTDVDDYAGHGAFVASSANYDGSRGMVGVQRPYWADGQTIDDAPFFALGEAAGDQSGAGLDFLDWDDDGVTDLAIGAPGADAGGAGSGSVFLVPGPR